MSAYFLYELVVGAVVVGSIVGYIIGLFIALEMGHMYGSFKDNFIELPLLAKILYVYSMLVTGLGTLWLLRVIGRTMLFG